MNVTFNDPDDSLMRLALKLAQRGYGTTSPNPMVGAVLVKRGEIIGRGWHRRAGGPHAEIEALRDAQKHGRNANGATLYVTLEPCSTHGRTPACTDAILAAGIKRVVVGATDPNPEHCGRAFAILKRAGVQVVAGIRGEDCARLNEAFNHWIVSRTPFVTVKSAMTLDGKIATASGESKWITSSKARLYAMKLRKGADAILVGVNTILADDPSLTARGFVGEHRTSNLEPRTSKDGSPRLRRIVLDAHARTPLEARIVSDEFASLTTIVTSRLAPERRVKALRDRVNVLVAPLTRSTKRGAPAGIDLRWVLKKLGAGNVTSLLVEGGGEVNASFLLGGLAQRVAFFYAPRILGGRDSRRSVAGDGIGRLDEIVELLDPEWRRLGPDLLLTARVSAPSNSRLCGK